jgi:UDP-4-amino-4-deoxy-L-arabinose-oxoglutarate aminotransferase
MKVEFYKHSLGEKEKEAVLAALDSLFLSTGPRTEEFEERFASYLNVKHCVGTSSGTAALFLALAAWGIGAGDEVVVPAMTFIASSNVALHLGAGVVFCDVDRETALIDPDMVEGILKKDKQGKVKAVMPVHLYGQMVDMKALRSIADRYGVKVLEDCAHCIEGERDGVRPGQVGDAGAFSFYATKNMTSGEGGALVCSDEKLAEKVRVLRLHGMSRSAADRYAKYQHWDMEELGYKANMGDLQAAILLPQMERLEELWQRRNAIALEYEEAFSRGGVDFPKTLPGVKHARHLFTIWAPEGCRDRLLEALQAEGIGCTVNYRAVHLRKYYAEKFGYKKGDYPAAEKIGKRTISIPLYPRLTNDEIGFVKDTIIKLCGESAY